MAPLRVRIARLETRVSELTVTLADVLEWLETGAVDGVRYDEDVVMASIRDAINKNPQ